MKHIDLVLALAATSAWAGDDAIDTTNAPTTTPPAQASMPAYGTATDSTVNGATRNDVGSGSASDQSGEEVGGKGAATAPSSDTYGSPTTSPDASDIPQR